MGFPYCISLKKNDYGATISLFRIGGPKLTKGEKTIVLLVKLVEIL
jgi:hypothetical protein